MDYFNLDEEMGDVLDSCGGEDLLRWLLKDDGIANWETIKLYPVLAYTPQYLDNPIVVGITHKIGNDFRILHVEYEYSKYPAFDKYLNYLLEMGNYQDPVEALLDHKRALLVDDEDIQDGMLIGWKKIMNQVIDGARDNKEDRIVDLDFYDALVEKMITNQKSMAFDLMSNLEDIVSRILNLDFESELVLIESKDTEDFDESFQNQWV